MRLIARCWICGLESWEYYHQIRTLSVVCLQKMKQLTAGEECQIAAKVRL